MAIPRLRATDSTLAFLHEGYPFIATRCDRLGTDAFRTRLMLRPVVCARGEEAARMFYAPGRFTRRGALPPHTLRLLQDLGSVATLDGASHARRKAMFLSFATPGGLDHLRALAREETACAMVDWQARGRVVLHEELCLLFTRIGLRWIGLPPGRKALVAWRSRDLVAMIEGAGSAGPKALVGLVLRRRAERWAGTLVARVRSGELPVADDAPLAVIARHTDDDGARLPEDVAAVELLNILRPTTAVARFGAFAAVALHEHPAWRPRVADPGDRLRFVDELRRLAPFFPVVAGRALEPFDWSGHAFAPGDWVILDLYGTNRHPRLWPDPGRFDPDRLAQRTPTPFDLIPQGGGGYADGHRCPGEQPTRVLLDVLVEALAAATWSLPPQDLTVDLARFPALPASGVVMEGVRVRDAHPSPAAAREGRREPNAP